MKNVLPASEERREWELELDRFRSRRTRRRANEWRRRNEFNLRTYPAAVRVALRGGDEHLALKLAVRGRYTNENDLNDLIFYWRHPERDGRAISRAERDYRQLSREWLAIRNNQVRPALRALSRASSFARAGSEAGASDFEGESLDPEVAYGLQATPVNRNSPDYVRWVQQSLNKTLGLRLAVDGINGTMTRSAIRSFQQKKGLVVDGIVGPQTESALIAAGAARPPASGTAVAAAGLPSYIPTSSPGSRPPVSYIPPQKDCEVLDNFGFNQEGLPPEHLSQIDGIAKRIIASQSTSRRIRSVQITGHTDPVGSIEYNLDLGFRRAEEAGDTLAEAMQNNKPGSGSLINLDFQSKGEADPISTTDMARNRRVEICLLTTLLDPKSVRRIRSGKRWFDTGGTPPMQPVRTGNEVLPLIEGKKTFEEMALAMRTAKSSNHYIYLLAWSLSEDLELIPGDPDTTILALFRDASGRGVQVRAMLDQRGPFETLQSQHINQWFSNGAAISDDRTLNFGSHHQKILIVKGEEGLITFCGGIDINSDRVKPTGTTPGAPFHDVHCRIKGPAAYDLLRIFLDRWQDHPDHAALDRAKGALRGLSETIPEAVGGMLVQIGRSYGNGTRNAGLGGLGYQFAPNGEQTSRRMILKAISEARRFIYIEDQYLVSMEISAALQVALQNIQHLTILIPDGSITSLSIPPGLVGGQPGSQTNFRRQQFISPLRQAGGNKVRVFFLNPPGAPGTYVHSKMMVVDDQFAIIGSANLCRRSLTHDSEATAGIFDPSPQSLAKRLRIALWARHLNMATPAGRAALVDGVASARFWLSPPAGARVAPCNQNANIEWAHPDAEWNEIDPDGS